jgi:hypothetical protein
MARIDDDDVADRAGLGYREAKQHMTFQSQLQGLLRVGGLNLDDGHRRAIFDAGR